MQSMPGFTPINSDLFVIKWESSSNHKLKVEIKYASRYNVQYNTKESLFVLDWWMAISYRMKQNLVYTQAVPQRH